MAPVTPSSLERLRDFVSAVTRLVNESPSEADLLERLAPALRSLVSHDDWLPGELARPHAQYYQQNLLHADPLERFSVVSFVWGPGQETPIHDHTVWGAIGMLRGEEEAQGFVLDAAGRPVPHGEPVRLRPGSIETVSPRVGDIHRVRNACPDRVSISIHVYGANIGAVRRSVYAPDGTRKPFISGYSNAWVPNLWDRSREPAAR